MKTIRLFVFAMILAFAFDGVASADLSDGLIAYYPFNGNADDESGNGNHGTVDGAVLTPDMCGTPDSAYSFDGIDDSINIGQNVKMDLPMSVSAWVKVNDMTNRNGIFRNDSFDFSYYGINFKIMPTGQITAQFGNGNSSGSHARNTKTTNESLIIIRLWYHVVVNFNGRDDIQIFVNGTEVAGSYEGTASSVAYSIFYDGFIGMLSVYTPVTYFNGNIDQVRVYDRSLSDSEVQQLFALGCGGDILFMDITLNQSSFTTGDTLEISAHTTNDDIEDVVDKKIAMQYASGGIVSLENICGYYIPGNADITEVVFTYQFNGSEPVGTYKVGGRLLNSSWGNPLSSDIEAFTFAP
jgi:hypothetical protein